MAPAHFGTQTIFAVIAMRRLGNDREADALAQALSEWTDWFSTQPAAIDFFATSLPSMLLFVDDPAIERDLIVDLIRAQLQSSVSA